MVALKQAMALLEGAPEEFQQQALDALMKVVDDYEEWRSLGEPPLYELAVIRCRRVFAAWRRTTAKVMEDQERRARDRRRGGG